MKNKYFLNNVLRFSLLLMLMVQANMNHLFAQCGNVSSYLPKVSATTICSGNQLYIRATGLPVVNWIYRDNNTGSWQVFSYNTDNASQYISVNANTLRTYKAVVSTLACPTDTTQGISVALTPPSFGNNNSIVLSASSPQVCSGGQVTLRLMNQGVLPVAWIYKDNGGAWTTYTYSSSQSITFGLPTVTSSTIREFKVLVKNSNSCNQDSSASLFVTILPSLAGNNNSIFPTSASSVVCGGNTVSLQVDWALEIGNWIYKDAGSNTWQYFTSGSTYGYDYNTNVSASVMREYKVILKDPTNCTADTSGSFFVMINASQRKVLSTIQPRLGVTNAQICAGNSMSLQLTGYNNIQSWIYKDSANGNWTSFSTSSYPSLNSSSSLTINVNREVRVVINNSALTCSYDTSAPIFYTIKANTKGNTSAAVPYTTNAELCIGAQPTIYLQNGMNVSSWLYRNNNSGSWVNASSSGNTYSDYNTGTFTSNGIRAYRAIINNTSTCKSDTTPEVQVLYKLALPGGTIQILPIINQSAFCAGSYISGSVSITGNRQVTKWIYRDNNTGIWNDLSNSNNTYFYDYNTSVTSSTVRSYKALVRTFETFTIDTTLEIKVDINPISRGNIGVTPQSTVASICNENSIALSIVPPTGYTVNNWLYKDTISSLWVNLGSSSTNVSNYVSTLNTQRIYRVVLLNNSLCKYDTTSGLPIAVAKKTARNNTSYLPIISNTAVCGGTAFNLSINLASGTNVLRWIYRDNNSSWKEIASSSTYYYESSTNTRVLVSTIREYKAIVSDNNNCFNDTSAGVLISIDPLSNGALSGINPTVTSSTICAGNTNSAVNINYNGTVQKWVFRDNGGVWLEFSNSTSSTYLSDNNTYQTAVTNRDYRAYLVRANSCLIDTTQIVSVQIRPATFGNAAAIQPTASAANVCSGSTFYTTINSGSGYAVHKWIYRNGLIGNWSEIASNTTSNTFYESATAVGANTLKSYRAIILTNTCSYDTTLPVSVQINARTYGYASSVAITSANGVVCSNASISANIVSSTMPNGASIRSWMYMDNMSNNWFAIPNTSNTYLTHNNTLVNVLTTRSYRTIINNPITCSYDSSALFSLSINPSGVGNATTITPTISATTFCNGSSNPNLTVSLPSGYGILKWMVNNNGTGWTDLGNATNSTYLTDYNTYVQTPVIRGYRAILSNSNTCTVDSSNTVSASINPMLMGVVNTVTPTSSRSNYCYTKTIQVSVNIPSGYVIEKWVYNDNSLGWNDFVNTTNSTVLSDNNTYVSAVTSRSYRVIMYNNTSCQRDTTAELAVVINPRGSAIGLRSVQPTASPSIGICSGSAVNLNVTPGIGNELMKWTYSDNGNIGPWIDALNSYNASSFSHQLTQVNAATSRLYRAIITDTSSCDFDSTLSIMVNITPISFGVDTSLVISGSDSVCIGTAVSLSVFPGGTNSVNKWIYRDNNGPWKDFTSSTQSTSVYDANTLLAPGYMRGYTPLVFKTSTCKIDTLIKVKTVTFKNKTFGNSTSSVTISGDTVCAGTVVYAYTSGTVERWLYKDGAQGSWNTITGASTSLSHNFTGVASSIWRYYRAILNTGSCNADSSRMDSVFLKILSNGNVSVLPTTVNSTICAGNSININLSLSNATMQRWIYRDNSVGSWNTLSVTSGFSITDYNTYVTSSISREYRAIVLRTCSYDTTNALVVTITPKANGTDISKIPSATSTSVCAASSIQNIQVNAGSGNTIMQWLSRDNGGAWKVFSSGNQNYLTDYNTLVGTLVTRNYVAIINNNSTCRFDTSAILVVTINPVVLGNSSRTVAIPSATCMGSNYSVTLNVTNDTTVIRFLSNFNGGIWSDEGFLTPTTNASISRFAYSGNAYTIGYRAITYKQSNCHIDTTAPLFASIISRSYGNDNSITPTGVSSACSGTSYSISVSAGSGNSISHWIYSDNAANWYPIYSSSASISQSALVNTSTTRQYRAIVIKGIACTIDTTASKSIVINPIIYGLDSTSQVTVTSSAAACAGALVNVSVSPGANSVNTWLYRDNGGVWNNLYNASINIGDNNTLVTSLVNREYSTVIWKASTCHLDTTLRTDTVVISTRTYGNDNGITITPSSNSICIGSAISLTANIGLHSVQAWYYSDNGGAWSLLTNNTSSFITDYNTGVLVSTIRSYKALIRKSNICAFDTSATTNVTINPRSIGVDLAMVPTANSTNACSGNIINLSINIGSGNSIQKWIYRQNGGVWTDFAYTSATSINDYNTNVVSTTTRAYRAIIIKGSGCSIDTSGLILVTINPIGFGSQSNVMPTANKSAICSGSNVTISVNGFTGSSILRWLYRDNNTGVWNILYSSASAITDFNTQTLIAFTRQYRAIVNNNLGCSTDTTSEVSVTINPISKATIATPTQVSLSTVCAGNPVNVFINPGSGRTVSSWLYTDVLGNWTLLNSTSATSINDFNTSVGSNTNRLYRAILSNAAGCSLDSSISVIVNINVITQGTNLAITPNSTTPSLCSGSTAIVSVSGFSGTVNNWIYRDSVVNGWSSIGSNNFTLFHTNTFVPYPRIRSYRAIIYNANNCSNDTSAEVMIQINPQLAGNANSIIPSTPNTSACEGSVISLTASGFINGGVVTGWVYSDNGSSWIRIVGAFGSNINHSNTAVSGLTTRQYRALVLTGCATDTTAATVVLIDKFPAKPSITIPSSTDSLVCSEMATTYEWRLNGNIIPGATAKVHVASVSGVYSVQIENTAGCKSVSDTYTHGMVGLANVFTNTKIDMYPNPTQDGNVNITWQGLFVDKATILVRDMLGRVVLEKELEVKEFSGTSINLSDNIAGLYFISISAKGNSIVKKILFQK